MILTREEIDYFKQNQHEITPELLEVIRAQGKEGKRVALEILDLPKNDKMFYLDAFGDPISYDGNRGLKKAGTVLALSEIHTTEIERCLNDFNYFRENYIQIRTQSGIDFPDIRGYQDRLINQLLNDDRENVVGLQGRQCISGETKLTMLDRDRTIQELFDNPEI